MLLIDLALAASQAAEEVKAIAQYQESVKLSEFSVTFLQLHSEMFPEMAKLISIILIIPVTSVPCERGFS